MPLVTVYDQTFQTTFAKPTDETPQYWSSAFGGPDAPTTGYPELALANAIKVATPGTLTYDGSGYGPPRTNFSSSYATLLNIGNVLVGSDNYINLETPTTFVVEYQSGGDGTFLDAPGFTRSTRLLDIRGDIGIFDNPITFVELENDDGTVTFKLRYASWSLVDVDLTGEAGAVDALPHQVKIVAKAGTYTAPSTIAFDGYIRMYWDGALIYEALNIDLVADYDNGAANARYVYGVGIGYDNGLMGPVSRVLITQGEGDPDVEVEDGADICCSDGSPATVKAGGGQGAGTRLVQTPTLGGSAVGCAGSGTVPTQADIVHSEAWW